MFCKLFNLHGVQRMILPPIDKELYELICIEAGCFEIESEVKEYLNQAKGNPMYTKVGQVVCV